MDMENFYFPLGYSWGEFYETLLQMQKNGDDHSDLSLQKCFDLVTKLDRATTLKRIQTLLKTNPLSFTEINRFNSACLDGLYASINVDSPFMEALKNSHFETCKFFTAKRIFSYEETVTESVYQTYLFRGCLRGCILKNDSLVDFFFSKMEGSDEKKWKDLNVSISIESIEHAKYLQEKGMKFTCDTLLNSLKKLYPGVYESVDIRPLPENINLLKYLVVEEKISVPYDILRFALCLRNDNLIAEFFSYVDIQQPLLNNIFSSACCVGTLPAVKILVEKGADLNYDNGFPLFHACLNDKKIAEYLIERGADKIVTLTLARGYHSSYFLKVNNMISDITVDRMSKAMDASGLWDFSISERNSDPSGSKPAEIDDVNCN